MKTDLPILTNTDPADETPVTYPPAPERWTRENYEMDEVERLTAQLDAARAEFVKLVQAETTPVFMREWLKPLGRALGVE